MLNYHYCPIFHLYELISNSQVFRNHWFNIKFFIVSTSLSSFKTFPLFIEFVSDGDDNLISFNVVFLFIGGIGGLVSCFFSELEFIDGAGDDLLELNGDGINGVEETQLVE